MTLPTQTPAATVTTPRRRARRVTLLPLRRAIRDAPPQPTPRCRVAAAYAPRHAATNARAARRVWYTAACAAIVLQRRATPPARRAQPTARNVAPPCRRARNQVCDAADKRDADILSFRHA